MMIIVPRKQISLHYTEHTIMNYVSNRETDKLSSHLDK